MTSHLEFPTNAEINVVLLNTWIKLCTVVSSALESTRYRSSLSEVQADRNSNSDRNSVLWTTGKTTSLRWEAELLQPILTAHEIPTRVIALGIETYTGQDSPAVLQVHAGDEQSAILLLSAVDEATEAFE